MQYDYKIIDNAIDTSLQERVWDFVRSLEYHVVCRDPQTEENPFRSIKYIPAKNNKEYLNFSNNQFMHRTTIGNNEKDLQEYPIILDLWENIKSAIGENYTIDGEPESIAGPASAWRVYVNIQPDESIKRSHTIHTDSNKLNVDNYYTLLYIANPIWHPSWYAENVFYEHDPNSQDKQQYQKGFGQSRGYGVGDPYAIIPPKAGRIILYDSRTLHTTRPASVWAEEFRYAIVFRLKKT